MGCWPSNFLKPHKSADQNDSIDEDFSVYAKPAPTERCSSKRSYTSLSRANAAKSGRSSASSGVYSAATSTTTSRRRSMLSRSGTNSHETTQSMDTSENDSFNANTHANAYKPRNGLLPKPKTHQLNANGHRKGHLKPKMLHYSICDDFNDADHKKYQQHQQHEQQHEKSFGYHTESVCTNSPEASPNKAGTMRCTMDHSRCVENLSSTSVLSIPDMCDVKMEMYMMAHVEGIMPKTSSPICWRRDIAYDPKAQAILASSSKSYVKWRHYLQTTPAHMLHNVTHIPEAIAGRFCPPAFPAFTDLDNMDSAAKRYKVDIEQLEERPCARMQPGTTALAATYVISTDL